MVYAFPQLAAFPPGAHPHSSYHTAKQPCCRAKTIESRGDGCGNAPPVWCAHHSSTTKPEPAVRQSSSKLCRRKRRVCFSLPHRSKLRHSSFSGVMETISYISRHRTRTPGCGRAHHTFNTHPRGSFCPPKGFKMRIVLVHEE